MLGPGIAGGQIRGRPVFFPWLHGRRFAEEDSAGIALLANGRKYTIEAVRVAPFWQAGTERAPNLMRGLSWSPRKKAENTWPAKRGPCLTSVSA